ncbi:MAG: hypothetical protein KDI55_25810, partial [Anaerolineae bacterium]|nr:hypothetical protein [Anaerolineae bacterium]
MPSRDLPLSAQGGTVRAGGAIQFPRQPYGQFFDLKKDQRVFPIPSVAGTVFDPAMALANFIGQRFRFFWINRQQLRQFFRPAFGQIDQPPLEIIGNSDRWICHLCLPSILHVKQRLDYVTERISV